MDFKIIDQEFISSRFIALHEPGQLVDGTLGTNNVNLCKHCTYLPERCFGHAGYIKLPTKIINPCFLSEIVEILTKTCWECGDDLSYLFDNFHPADFLSSVREFTKRHDVRCVRCHNKVRVDVRWNSEDNVFESCGEEGKYVDQLQPSALPEKLDKYVMKFIPVFPVYNNDINDPLNRRIIASLGNLFNPNTNAYFVYSTIIGTEKNSKFQSVKKMICSKNGLIEQNILGKRVNFCMRSVIVPDRTVDVDQVLVPRQALKILRVKEGEMVLFNRQPSLVRQSIISLRVKARSDDEKVLAFNPCLCGGFNADFDGDEMNLFVADQGPEMLAMLPQNNIMSLRTGKPVICPHQDCLLGLSFSSEFAQDTKTRVQQYITDNYQTQDINRMYKDMQEQAYNNLDRQEFSLTDFKLSIKRIIESGARGSQANWKMMFEEMGEQYISELTKTDAEISTEITSNLEQGLNFDQYFVHAQSSRESICSTGVTTASSGHISKKLSRLLGGVQSNDK
ncbi:hypothetical protein GGF37_000824 [Kickxella alabastrina]|nr:hypothetical protein GGF37_000824 [Kickxella alabastrina]